MLIKYLYFYVTLFCVTILKGNCAEPAAPEFVTTLTKDNFDDFIQNEAFTVVEFYAPWCGHCKRLAPEYEEAAKVLKEEGITLAKIDATIEADIATRYDVQGYPTLKVFRNGKEEEYKGGRTKDTIVQWVKRMIGPAVIEAETMEAAKEYIEKTPLIFIGSVKSLETPAYKLFERAAEAHRSVAMFIAVADSSLTTETIMAIRAEEGATHSIELSDADTIHSFVDVERFPLFGGINADNYADYFQSGREIIWYIGSPDEYAAATSVIRQSAPTFRSQFNFVWLNADVFKDHAQNVLGVTKMPALVLQKVDGRYVYPENVFDDHKKINDFINLAIDGKIEKNLISEDIPEQPADDPVQIIVGKTFMDALAKPVKDTFLEIYAPWCGHCKQFDPIYRQFAESVKKYSHIAVAKMDGTKNESPLPKFQWNGFPTIFFIKAGTEDPVLYEGPRTLEGLQDYIKQHGSKPLDDITEPPKDEL